jgi:hypothetical protein
MGFLGDRPTGCRLPWERAMIGAVFVPRSLLFLGFRISQRFLSLSFVDLKMKTDQLSGKNAFSYLHDTFPYLAPLLLHRFNWLRSTESLHLLGDRRVFPIHEKSRTCYADGL